MRYLISYDLLKSGKDYQKLWDALKTLGAVRVLESEWVAHHGNSTPLDMAKYLWAQMDANDRLLVTEMPDNYAKANLMADPK